MEENEKIRSKINYDTFSDKELIVIYVAMTHCTEVCNLYGIENWTSPIDDDVDNVVDRLIIELEKRNLLQEDE